MPSSQRQLRPPQLPARRTPPSPAPPLTDLLHFTGHLLPAATSQLAGAPSLRPPRAPSTPPAASSLAGLHLAPPPRTTPAAFNGPDLPCRPSSRHHLRSQSAPPSAGLYRPSPASSSPRRSSNRSTPVPSTPTALLGLQNFPGPALQLSGQPRRPPDLHLRPANSPAPSTLSPVTPTVPHSEPPAAPLSLSDSLLLSEMIVSALLTSVGINLGLCMLYFALYSVFRKQPRNIQVYAPRLVVEGKAQTRGEFNLESLLPTPGWVMRAWKPSEEELLASCGLDAVVFMRIYIFSLRVFFAAAIMGICILLPINYLGDQLRDIDYLDISNKSLGMFSISNVKNGSNWLWFHFSAAYVITGVVCYLLYSEYKYISIKRLEQFSASKLEAQHFTILVRGIPSYSGSSLSDTVEKFFTEYHPTTYLSHVVVRRTNKLRGLIRKAENICRRVARLNSRPSNTSNTRQDGCLGMFGKNKDLVSYSKRLEDLEENVRLQQSSSSMAVEEVPAAFVCFKSRYGASTALHFQQSVKPTEWVTEQAPEPHDVHWPLFSTSYIRRWISKLVVVLASIVLIILFLLPVAFVQGLTNLDQLETLLPFLRNILNISIVSQVITGYLPSLILQLFLSTVPPIMKIFSTMQGYISFSGIEKSACSKMLWFTIWNAFFANVLTGSVTSQFKIFLEPKNIPSVLAVAVPGQASFYIAYVVTSWTSLSSGLTRVVALLCDWIGGCSGCSDDELHAPSMPYHSEIPRLLLFLLLGLTYFLLAPLILPFILVFFCFGYIIFRNQLLNVYLPKYETGGQFWPIVHNWTIFSLILMQAIAFGIFGLKKLPLASSLLLPLPLITLLFNDYCQNRFQPIFEAYSAESLIKKDRSDQDVQGMTEFFNKLLTAYDDPALMPMQRSQNTNDLNAPLLSSSIEV